MGWERPLKPRSFFSQRRSHHFSVSSPLTGSNDGQVSPPIRLLSLVLSSFFAVALLALSIVQSESPLIARQLQAYLFGQVATMQNVHLYIYGPFALLTVALVLLFFRPLQAELFDPVFALTSGLPSRFLEALLWLMTVIAVVVGIRSAGVVLVSAMLILPPATARFFVTISAPLSSVPLSSGSGFLGMVLSHELSMSWGAGGIRMGALPTGPMIVLVAGIFFSGAALFAKEKGLLSGWFRYFSFTINCRQENLLKALWKSCSGKQSTLFSPKDHPQLSSGFSFLALRQLEGRG